MGARAVLTRTIRWTSAAIAIALAGSAAAGCIEDLPPPAVCPPPALHPVGDCLTPLEEIPEYGCLTQEQSECLTGPRSSCTCFSTECPTSPDACFPEGDCPPRIVEAVGPEAACNRLAVEDFGSGLPSEYQCLCGCGGCAAVCDGAGPVYGIATNGELMYGIPTIAIADRMPSSGRLGVYVRVRGLSETALVIFKGGDGEEVAVMPNYFITITVSADFTELVFFDQEFFNLPAYAWQNEADKPTLLALYPVAAPDSPTVTLMEVDCLIPFVLPP